MKIFVTLAFCIAYFVCNAQLKNFNPDHKNDTILNVVYKNEISQKANPAYFINGKHIKDFNLATIDPNNIDNIKVVKKEFTTEMKSYYGQINIFLKKGYSPKWISLTDLKKKYIKSCNIPTIFMLNDDFIKSDYSDFVIDEKYVQELEVEAIDNQIGNFQIVRIFTKTEENIKKANEIWIR
ncbi:hypothetical protein [Marinifilum fragile]|uniref:hypothetical protein n=1 Tax=Marinifilum fragile TaxID=570161 RepID=UPI002AA6F707|nr:hypothetical protein [Marinifilum fragile]